MRSGTRLLIASLAAWAIFPCSVDTTPAFLPIHVPEKFDAAFIRGDLGIIPATLLARNKLIAWRYLSGLTLTAEERQSLLPKQRVGPDPDPAAAWQIARNPGGAGPAYYSDKSSKIDKGVFYTNCTPDAFATAAQTLNDRRRKYPNAASLQAWEAAQDQVFLNCSGETPVYPADPDPAMPPLARADRIYQIAAAHFYAEDLGGAEQRFRAIAADTSSPWHDTAAYMIARTLIREGSLLHKPGALEAAKAQLQKVNATGLIGYVDSLLDPLTTLKSVADRLAIPHPGADIAATIDLGSYVMNADRFAKVLAGPGLPEPFDWMRTLDAGKPDYALQRWNATHSTPWLTAALILAKKGDPDLIEAGLKVPQGSPAFDTATFHALRLMIAGGQTDEARRRLDILLSAKRRDLDSVDNAFRGERLSLATSYVDFLRWTPRRPIGYEEDDFDPGSIDDSPILAADSVDVFNYFAPLPKLVEAAENTRLSAWPRTQLATAAWARAFILSDDDIANRAVPLLAKAQPAWAADLSAFSAATGEARRFAGALLIERHSEIQPHVSSDIRPKAGLGYPGSDWWCAEPSREKEGGAPSEAVLSKEDQDKAAHEVDTLIDSGPTQTFLAPIVMGWAKSHPSDPRVPEALHRLVRITRYGCRGNSDNGAVSKAAFDLLHQRYPSSTWARQTPYWFDK